MRLCIVNTLADENAGGGAERSVAILARGLAAIGNEVTLVGLTSRAARWTAQDRGVQKIELPLLNSYWPFDGLRPAPWRRILWHWRDRWNDAMATAFAEELRRLGPDVLVTNNLAGFSTAIWGAAKNMGIPIVHIVRDYYLLCPNSTMTRGSRECVTQCRTCHFLRRDGKENLKNVDRFLSISDYIAAVHERVWEQLGIFQTIGNPIEPLGVLQAPRESHRALKFGYLGRLVPTKGVREAIMAFKRAAIEGELLIAGSGPGDYSRVCEQAAIGANVRFLGRVPASELIGQIDVLLVPSLWGEAFGRVAIEAASAGIPSMVSAKGALPELIEVGETGWVFHDFEELVTLLRFVSEAPEQLGRMREACLRRAALFSPKVIAGRVDQIAREVAAGRIK